MFLGEFTHSVDAKGRLAIPAKFRLRLGEGAVVTRGLDGCLVIYPAQEWQEFAEKLDKLPATQPDVRDYKRFIFSGATECDFDRQGRVRRLGVHPQQGAERQLLQVRGIEEALPQAGEAHPNRSGRRQLPSSSTSMPSVHSTEDISRAP